jgi:ribosome-binding protein aMBF1 (putative translation factor)
MTFFSLASDPSRHAVIRVISDVRHALNEAFVEEHKATGLTKTDIAHKLDVDKSFISKKFSGESNLTFVTFAQLADAMDRDVKILLPSRRATEGNNTNGLISPPPSTSRMGVADSKNIGASIYAIVE